jgi:hypothetical protein
MSRATAAPEELYSKDPTSYQGASHIGPIHPMKNRRPKRAPAGPERTRRLT